MKDRSLKVRHVYSHEAHAFELELNTALREVASSGGEVVDLHYAMDPATADHRRGGFGALIVYQLGAGATDADEAYG